MDSVKITELDLFRFSLPLKSEIVIGTARLNRRDGYILRLTNEHGHVGAGEIVPLAGFSAETLESAPDDIARLRFTVYGSAIPVHLEELSGGFDRWIGKLRLGPSVRFGFESAVLRLMAHEQGISVASLLSETASEFVTSQGLLAGSAQDILKKVTSYYAQGWRTFKVKVGRGELADDLELLSQIRKQSPHDMVIRADANEAWDVDTALSFLREAKLHNVQYVEEPARTWEELEECISSWRPDTHAPIALDEHLNRFTAESLPDSQAISAIILKPSLLGVEASVQMARRAHILGKNVVYSSPFESAVGFAMTSALAASGRDRNSAHGFDAYSWMKNDLAGVSVGWNGPKINITQFNGLESRIQWDQLEETAID
jgi:o-succinylbenzoate synthase